MPFFGQFLMFLEVISILNDWLQLMILHLNSTKFLENFDTSYSSEPVLIRKLILSIEIVLYGKILSEKSLCAHSHTAVCVFFLVILPHSHPHTSLGPQK